METRRPSTGRMLLRLFMMMLAVGLAAVNAVPAIADTPAVPAHLVTDPAPAFTDSRSDNTTITTPEPISPLIVQPASGPAGTSVTVTGSGFKANDPVVVAFDNVTVKADGAVSSGDGKFVATFNVPTCSGGSHVVEAYDGTVIARGSFTVTPTASLDPASGYIGTPVSVNATGFLGNRLISIIFGNSSPVKTIMSGAGGSVNTTFAVPPQAAGTYKVVITDGTDYKDLGFIITIDASVDPATTSSDPGYVGQLVSAQGAGFVPGKSLTVTFDDQEVAVGSIGSNSRFSVTFNVPPSKGGAHTVTLTDGVNSFPLPFFVETTPPPAPALLTPQSGGDESAQATFSWQPVTDISGVTYTLEVSAYTGFSPLLVVRPGITTASYTLSKSERLKPSADGAAYYWRVKAVDGAFNSSTWSDTRYFSVTAPSLPWIGYTLWSLAGLIVILTVLWLVRRSRAAPRKPEQPTD